VILSNDVREHAVLLSEIADAMFDQRLHEDALRIYEILSADETVFISLSEFANEDLTSFGRQVATGLSFRRPLVTVTWET